MNKLRQMDTPGALQRKSQARTLSFLAALQRRLH